ncbi:hypothetical protein PSEUBRA_004516 [Kalmanozyma brasiliensis GHG001]|uniref:Uncharacterized protein n=1 Tax=Kalmanozyma brasiliensis (strain GHG001) TaxID=1365824 RepID=V5EWE0_KALBG|nr:uncharacterized protein PSEUBRA_004516 [Kalmanozyma brasiliensis GHG001]EST06604.1 hypothetical protein PSEUBRA_004516 [Kalmanozyma brasiliensis GHG001]
MAGIYRRSLARVGRKDSEIAEIRTTPADELSSWLGDDVCTNCGASTPHGKLFCSEACKLADASEVAHASLIESLASPLPPSDEFSKGDNGVKFRYPCPPSPSLLAQMSAPLRTTYLTSPALAAYQSSLPVSRGRFSLASTTSNDAGVEGARHTKKRSSSQSTFSSISESGGSQSAFASTDPSTPSPAYEPVEDESSDLDAHDFQLPPSVSTASSVMLRKSSAASSSSSSRARSSSRAATAPHPINADGRTPKSPLWYARRPSNTNARGSYYTSPAVTATTMVTAIRRDHRASTTPSTSTSTGTEDVRGRPSNAEATMTRKSAKDVLSQAFQLAAGTSQSKTFAVRRGRSEQLDTRSPPPSHSLASSAGKTLRGGSPTSSSRNFSPISTELGCDRCRTISNLSGEHNVYGSSLKSSNSRGLSSSPRRESEERYRSIKQYHKHSHSAAAGFFFTHMESRDALVADADKPQEREGRRIESSRPHRDAAVEDGQQDVRATPPRGRSKARGRSSHRRSPSPPRAAARRDSSLVDEVSRASPAPISPRSQPISISMMARDGRRSSGDDAYHHDEELRSALPQRPSPLALISEKEVLGHRKVAAAPEADSDDTRGRGRGRSTRRGRGSQERGSTSRSRSRWILQDCEVTWGGYGHLASDRGEKELVAPAAKPSRSQRSRTGRANPEFTDPGFDDVDLELDGDDERDESVSSGGSFESTVARGRTSLRT